MSRAWIAVCAVACGGGQRTEPRPAPLGNEWNAPSMLAAVPADTPYLSASLEPMSQIQRWLTFESADKSLAKAIAAAELIPAGWDRSQLPPFERMALAFADELRGKDLATWGQALGFHASGRYILYGLSVWPVLRVEIADAAKLRGVLGRVLGAAGPMVTERSFGEIRYWRHDHAKAVFVAAVLEDELVAAALPPDGVEQGLPLVFGTHAPARNLRDAGTLTRLSQRYATNVVGYLDIQAMAERFLRPAPAETSTVPPVLHPDAATLSTECRNELGMIAGLVPRLVLGQRESGGRNYHATFVLEMPRAITSAIQGLQTRVPHLVPGLDRESFMSIGAAVDVNRLLQLLGRLTAHFDDQPFRCEWLAPIGPAMHELDQALQQLAPVTLFGIDGAAILIDDVTLEPETMTARAVLVADNAAAVLDGLLGSMPGLAGHPVPADGRPLELPLHAFGLPPNFTANVMARPGRGVVAVGPASLSAAEDLLDAPAPDRSPLLSFAFDATRFLALDPEDEELRSDLSGVKYISLQLEVSDDGLVGQVYATFLPR